MVSVILFNVCWVDRGEPFQGVEERRITAWWIDGRRDRRRGERNRVSSYTQITAQTLRFEEEVVSEFRRKFVGSLGFRRFRGWRIKCRRSFSRSSSNWASQIIDVRLWWGDENWGEEGEEEGATYLA